MEKIVISGAPHSGKTTLFESLKKLYPQYDYVSEPATEVLRQNQDTLGEEGDWRNIFESPLLFCTLCVKQSLISESSIKGEVEYAFLDRSLIDTIAYARRDKCEELIPIVKILAERATYHTVLFCEPVGSIQGRVEDTAAAQLTHDLLKEPYEELNINTIQLPSLPTEQRLDYIKLHLNL